MVRVRWAIQALAIAAAVLLATGGGAIAQGGKATSAAGLIVDTGEGEPIHVVVTFSGGEITALDALRAAELDAVTVAFGGLGEAVCEIADTGCDVRACRQRVCQTGNPDSPFWQYWEQDEAGNWTLSPLGASQATLGDGEIAAWIWTGPAPDLEPVAWDDMAARAGAPAEITGEPAVYTSRAGVSAGTEGDPADVLAAAGVVVLVGTVGGWLVLRQRRGAGRAA